MKLFQKILSVGLLLVAAGEIQAEQILLYDSVKAISAPQGYVVYSESSTNSAVLKTFTGNRTFNAAGYVKRPEGTFYVSDWSLEQNKATGRAPSWIFLTNSNRSSAPPSNSISPAPRAPAAPSSTSIAGSPDVESFLKLVVGQSMLYTLAADYQEKVSNGTALATAKAELKSKAQSTCLNMGCNTPGETTDKLRNAFRALGDGAEYEKATFAVFGAFKAVEMDSLALSIQDPRYSYFLKLRQDLSKQYEAMKEGRLAIRKFNESLPWNS